MKKHNIIVGPLIDINMASQKKVHGNGKLGEANIKGGEIKAKQFCKIYSINIFYRIN